MEPIGEIILIIVVHLHVLPISSDGIGYLCLRLTGEYYYALGYLNHRTGRQGAGLGLPGRQVMITPLA